jgi:ParB family transcriptional regulator, chromosome partitioning protein
MAGKEKRGLGMGLRALIPGADTPQGVQEVDVDAIAPNPRQPRQKMDPEALQELADSIKQLGLIQPLIVSAADPAAAPGVLYTLIAGERRLTAAKLAGMQTIPVIVREATPQQMLELALVENVQRADLNPLEEAAAYRQLVDDFALTQEQVADRVGKSRVAVTNTLRLLSLPDKLKDALMEGEISEGHARALLGLETPEMQIAALEGVRKRQMSVHATEEYVRRLNEAAHLTREAEPDAPQKDVQTAALEEDFRRSLGTKVELFRSTRGGRVVIYFYSEEELEGIYGMIVRV